MIISSLIHYRIFYKFKVCKGITFQFAEKKGKSKSSKIVGLYRFFCFDILIATKFGTISHNDLNIKTVQEQFLLCCFKFIWLFLCGTVNLILKHYGEYSNHNRNNRLLSIVVIKVVAKNRIMMEIFDDCRLVKSNVSLGIVVEH